MRNYWFITILAIVLWVSLAPQITLGQPYSWTDEQGRICFADDFSQVPEKYKKSAVPVGPTKEQLKRHQDDYMKNFPSTPEPKPQKPDIDLMEDFVRRFPGTSYEWTDNSTLWIKVPAGTAYAKEIYSETASAIAASYHLKWHRSICVWFYYGDGKVIVSECK